MMLHREAAFGALKCRRYHGESFRWKKLKHHPFCKARRDCGNHFFGSPPAGAAAVAHACWARARGRGGIFLREICFFARDTTLPYFSFFSAGGNPISHGVPGPAYGIVKEIVLSARGARLTGYKNAPEARYMWSSTSFAAGSESVRQ